MAGPSRTEKINQAAASLAINDYIAGKRSKENMEMMLEKTKFGVDYTLDAQKAAKDIKGMDFGEALTFYSENVFKGKKGRMDPQTIKGVLSIQMPGKQINIKNFTKKNKNEVAVLDATEFDVGINIVTYKGGKMLVERVGDSVTEVPNLFIT
jgi:translation initiation factor RLI1